MTGEKDGELVYDSGDLAKSLAIEEYKSLRAESSSAKNNQQTILQWSLAAAGIIVAGAIAVTRPAQGFNLSDSYTLVSITLCTVMPLLIGGAFGVWIGEVERMERVGRFLRERERATWPTSCIGPIGPESAKVFPIMWENTIFDSNTVGDREYGKNFFGAAAACAIFAGLFGLSLAFAVILIWTAPTSLFTSPLLNWMVTGWSSALLVVGIVVFGRKLRILKKASTGEVVACPSTSTPPVSIDVVLPALNEKEAIPWIVKRLPPGYTAIIVDNASTDSTARVSKELGVRVASAPIRGVGLASTTGVLASQADIVCVIDCDATVDPADLPRLVQPILDGRSDLVIGSRCPTLKSVGLMRLLLFRSAAFLVRLRFGVAISDLGSARAFRRSLFEDEYVNLHQRNGWSVDMIRAAVKKTAQIEEVKMAFHPRIGRSKITGTPLGCIQTGIDTIDVILRK